MPLDYADPGGDTIERLLQDGASQIVIGTRALEHPEWLAEMALLFPGELIVAADVRERQIVTRGWQRQLPRNILDVVDELNGLEMGAGGLRRRPG